MVTPNDVHGRTVPPVDHPLLRAERRVEAQRERADRWRAKFDELLDKKRKGMRLLSRIHELLLEGDVPAAIDLLAVREAARTAARERREAKRRAREERES